MTDTMTKAEWQTRAERLVFRTQPFIDGSFVSSSSEETFAPINPATGREVCRIAVGSAEDVDRAVKAARVSFQDGRWRKKSPLTKKSVLLRIADLIEKHGDELALLDVLEMGKTISNAKAELGFSAGFFRYYAEAIDKLNGDVIPADISTLAFNLLVSRGVVGAIIPWNFPLIMASLKVAPILAAGNSVVLKPSEIASTSSLRLAELATEAGVPNGVFNVVTGLGKTVGEAIGRHHGIDMLSFTGSTQTGRRLMAYSGESNGKPLLLELGGKSPQIITADMRSNIKGMVSQIMHEAFWNQGQWCVARSRLIVEAPLRDALVDALVKAAAEVVPGDTLDPSSTFGAIATTTQMERIQSYVTSAREDGARLLTPDFPVNGCFMSPMIFGEVTRDMRIAREEIFGPVMSIHTFTDFDEALDLANDTQYGLAASLWTKDLRRAHQAITALDAGKLTIRSTPGATEQSGFALASEGWGASGFGAEGGMAGLRSYCRLKAVELVS
ncbi:hypothetical protein UP10_41190 [Bradyrhizobium sp. LTSPM299]|uniref:aldehyde dehydrogenase family protein n=1 Tax=Bradyrhizobium sp. LTSPM299 TaxID=1619233 RepID=UPI0005C9A729|nr:aldehyde dehydrogenase family protein [Bradyrhizobium sp. LTSPM299]KJC54084.1 hypothetical protein UP10_41190 [Bradyrhizobium sp. LTSPM299]